MAQKPVVLVGQVIHGTCSVHGAITLSFTVGSPTTDVNGSAVVRIGDTGTCSCGHTCKAVTGSTNVFADGIGVHRQDDTGNVLNGVTVVGTYTADTGSPIYDAA
jgi:uncharacterized Zn-binding protein involved in type VI secretion